MMQSRSTKLYKTLQKRYSRRINLDLKRIKKALQKLNLPHLNLNQPINFIGSDGKMSTLTSLKFFLEAHNKKVTAFTSPHLYDLRQRFWLKDRYISLLDIKKFQRVIENTKSKLTLFELLTCIYILAAKKETKIDYNLIEAGLLFNKDSTNLWRSPRAQVITNINLQHQDWINPKTINEICKQKLSSLSQNTTIYVAKQNPKVLKIIKKILNKNESKKIYSNEWKIQKNKSSYTYKDERVTLPIKSNNIHSIGLINNLGLSIKIALDFGVPKKTIIKTIPKIFFEGRIQYLKKGKFKRLIKSNERLLVDGCHSTESAKNLYNYLKTLNEPIYGIWGMQKNKSPENFIKIFKKIFKKVITIRIPNEPNSCTSNELAMISKKYFESKEALSIKNALTKVSDGKPKTIVVFGSLYLIGNLLSLN